MSAAPILTILRNGETVRSLPIEGEAMLGRGEGCLIRLEDRAISRQHAVFKALPEGVQVERKSEFAPLSVNGAECTRAVVKEGDIISIGPYLMRLSMPVAAPAPPPSAPTASPAAPLSVGADDENLIRLDGPPPGEGLDVPPPSGPTELETGAAVQEIDVEAEGGIAPPVPDAAGPDTRGAGEGASVSELQEVDIGVSEADIPVDPDGETRLNSPEKLTVKLLFKPGTANVEEFDVTQDEISIGRGKNCDVVLLDKKSSRKNSIIRRQGLAFIIKDLDSANGTYVNGSRVKEQILTGDDLIRVGSVEFQFKALSSEYVAKQAEFAPIPPPTGPEEPVQPVNPISDSPADLAFAPGAGGDAGFPVASPGEVGGADPFSGGGGFTASLARGVSAAADSISGLIGVKSDGKKKSLVEKFRALPKPQQYVVIVLIIGALWYLNEDEPEEVRAVRRKPKPVASAGPVSGDTSAVTKGPGNFESLTSEQKRFVESQHTIAFDLYKNKEYDKSLFEIGKIFALVSDYKDSREIERYAKEGKRKLEAVEDEKRKKEEESRLKAKLERLVGEAKDKMAVRDFAAAKEVFDQILAIDPENASVGAWKKEIEDQEEKKNIEAQQKMVRDEVSRRAWGIYRQGEALVKRGSFRSGIAVLLTVSAAGSPDPKLASQTKALIASARASIVGMRDPILEEAKKSEGEGDLRKAYGLYQKATVIDPPHPTGYAGMDRIRGILHERAKGVYTEAVLAESYSDFSGARKKFKEVVEIAPEGDSYHESARRKLARYFDKEKEESQ